MLQRSDLAEAGRRLLVLTIGHLDNTQRVLHFGILGVGLSQLGGDATSSIDITGFKIVADQ